MERDIKTRRVVKDIKTLTHRAGVSHAVKTAAIKTRETASSAIPTQEGDQSQPDSDTAQTSVQHLTSKATTTAAKTIIREQSAHTRAKQAKKHAQETARKEAQPKPASQASETAPARQEAATTSTTRKAAPTKTKATRAASKQPKTPAVAGHAPVKTAQQATYATTPPANALKALTRRNSYTSHAAVHTPRGVARKAVEGARSFAKMAAIASRSLGTALAALGGTALSVVVVITLAALIAVSAFGIFFTGGDRGDGNPTLREVVTNLNSEHTARIEKIKADNPHDKVVLSGSKTAWKETLSVFAVKTTTDADNPLDVVTLDASRQKLIETVFWDMNKIGSRVEEKQTVEIVLEEDTDGNPVEVNKTTTERNLHIELSHTTADEAASVYGFGSSQLDTLHQLLSDKYDTLWQSVLYGIGNGGGSGSSDIVEVAASQLGNVGGAPYWSWYGFGGRVEWCACFVSWCADQCGYIAEGSVPKFAYCPSGSQWFKDAGRWKDRGSEPLPGDIIFFDWGGDGVSDHVGIVESCDGSTVYTIEGNSGDKCQRNSYSVGSISIIGYGFNRTE